MILYTIIFFMIIIIILWYFGTKKPKNYPPGPKWYPIVGSAIQIKKLRNKYGMFCTVIDELIKKYPNCNGVIGLKIGKDKLVIAHTADAIKELMLNEDLDGRPDGSFYKSRTFGTRKGLIVTDGEFWQEQRRFIVRHLKDYGFARRGMSENISNEVQHLCNYLYETIEKQQQQRQNNPSSSLNQQHNKYAIIEMHDLFGVNILNTLWTMLAGVRYDRDNDELMEFQQLFFELLKNVDMIGSLFSHFPILCYIAPNLSGYNHFIEVHRRFYKFIKREVDRHRYNLKLDNEPKDLIDTYLYELESNNCKSSFSEQQLLAACLDLFLAGTETTNKSLGFAFLHMTRDISIQKKAQLEIDSVIGRERLPTWDDRPNLPYCEAICHEALRFFMGNSFGVPHRAMKNTKLCGFDIEKDTMVIGCFRGMLMNNLDYVNPKRFWPDRFIVNDKLQVPSSFAPFGAGRHRCMGEVLGRQNLFMFITTLLQNFQFLPIDNEPLPDDEPLDGVTPAVKPFKAKVVPR